MKTIFDAFTLKFVRTMSLCNVETSEFYGVFGKWGNNYYIYNECLCCSNTNSHIAYLSDSIMEKIPVKYLDYGKRSIVVTIAELPEQILNVINKHDAYDEKWCAWANIRDKHETLHDWDDDEWERFYETEPTWDTEQEI